MKMTLYTAGCRGNEKNSRYPNKRIVVDADGLWKARVDALLDDSCVSDKRGIFEYVLSGEQDKKLLNIRVFTDAVKKRVYKKQTDAAKKKGISNCPYCAMSNNEKEKEKSGN